MPGASCYHPRVKKPPLEPLIPLAEFGKLVARIAKVPKEAVTARKAQPKAKKAKPRAKNRPM
jgi:hypothetical protein